MVMPESREVRQAGGLVCIGAGPDDCSCTHGIFSEEGRPFPSCAVPLARAVLMQRTRGPDVKVKYFDVPPLDPTADLRRTELMRAVIEPEPGANLTNLF